MKKWSLSVVLAGLLTGTHAWALPSGWLDVRDFDRDKNGVDAAEIQAAIDACKADNTHGVVYLPTGTYHVDRTIYITRGEFYGCRIIGDNPGRPQADSSGPNDGVHIVSHLTGGDAVFAFVGGSGKFSNAGLENVSIVSAVDKKGQGTGILIDGQDFAIVRDVRIAEMKYGIWLDNRSPGAFTELNQFHRLELQYCTEAIRIERSGGNESFHGNVFDKIYINIGADQIGLNHISGYLYNARFDLFMWAHQESSVYIRADGVAEHNIGNVTFESFARGKFEGNGRFWFEGFVRGIGGLTDDSIRQRKLRVFAATNYITPKKMGESGMKPTIGRTNFMARRAMRK